MTTRKKSSKKSNPAPKTLANIKRMLVKLPVIDTKKITSGKVWITRHELDGENDGAYFVWTRKPEFNSNAGMALWVDPRGASFEPDLSICADGFERVTSWKLPGGAESIIELEFPRD